MAGKLTPEQLKSLEEVINSSVLTGVGSPEAGYQMGANKPVYPSASPAPLGTTLTSKPVKTFDVDEYGSPILSEAKDKGSGMYPGGGYNPDASPFARVSPPGNRLPVGDPGIPGSEFIAPPTSTLMEDRQIIADWRSRNPVKFYTPDARGVLAQNEPLPGQVEWTRVPPGRTTPVVAAPWGGLATPGGRASAPAKAPTPVFGLSLGSNGVSAPPTMTTNAQESKFQFTDNTHLPPSMTRDDRWK